MKHILLPMAVALLATTNLSAQIILTQSSYPSSVVGTDSIVSTTVASSFPALTSMAGATWDMSTITDSTQVSFVYRVSAPYGFADSNFYNFGTYSYQGNIQSAITSTGLLSYGIVIPRAGYSITSLTSGATDSLIIPAQSDTFSTPRTVIKFPATANDTWSSSYHNDFNFELSEALLSYNHAPGILRSYVTETDTVKGYGKMRVKTLAGMPSSYFNVLQVQTTITNVDSFFINGAPATAVLLTELGFTQGQSSTTYTQEYYRPEEVTPLAQVSYNNATFSQPVSAKTHVQRLVNEGVASIANETNVDIYPNPVTGGNISLRLPALSGPWSYGLTDITGKTVQADELKSNGGYAQFSIPLALPSGIFCLRLYKNGNLYCAKPIEIAK